MWQSFLFSFFLVLPAICHFRILITGTVVDSKTKKPVEIVYVKNKNKNQYEHITFSTDDGSFSIYADRNDTIEFHRINYEMKTVVVKNDENMTVEMRPKTYMLDEVVVTFEAASDIYTKAVNNLRSKYLKGVSVYLWHGAESRNSEKS
ncbi:MAG: carboxypeptidase-like regulatory domain-containing protein [Tannerella sp.]|jgi:hypothetical protein|nr:carboxypeptidase-like regulatory domain-containing protein [Tannerella sp.]